MLKVTVADNNADTATDHRHFADDYYTNIIILKQQKSNNRTVFLLHINHLENSHSHRADRVFELQNALQCHPNKTLPRNQQCHLIALLKLLNRATVYFRFVLENA